MDSQYTVLARRFRPQTFGEVVGQDRISQTLRNAIREGRVAHAYLFTGARGVGKTSMARIFAKALNCPHVDKDGIPCNQCEICRGISTGQDVDVSEIDGASNRGIDDIRSLRANVGVKSMRSTYKVYIIDEVHMLTKEAFNALLKTLEEPPPRVKFIFCTTEPNKVPDTILSRCQRFDFGTISIGNISLRLKQLADAEGVDVDTAALELVARRAAGSMRDSQSLFDQLLAFGAKTITALDVHRLLGTAPDDRIVGVMNALIDRDRAAALGLLDQALNDGVQLEALTDQFVSYFRDLMVMACGAREAALLSVGDDQRETLVDQATRWGLQTIVAAMQIMAETKSRMQRVTFGRALAELALIRVSMLEDLDRLDDLVAKLRGGASLAGGIASRAPASTSTRPSPESGSEKKNDLGPAVRARNDQIGTQTLGKADGTSSAVSGPEEEAPAAIDWKPGCEKELHAAVLNQLSDMTGTHLSRVSRTAISGPSQLDFYFPANYDLDRRLCDRPDIIGRLQVLIARLVGKEIRIRFLLSEAVAVEPVKPVAAAIASAVKGRVLEQPDDPFLQDLMTVLGITGWKPRTVSKGSGEADG